MKIKFICGNCASEDIKVEDEYDAEWYADYDEDGYADEYCVDVFVGHSYKCKTCGAEDNYFDRE